MRWRGRQRSQNVEDRRGTRPRRAMIGGGAGLVLVLLLALLGVDGGALQSILGLGVEARSEQGVGTGAGRDDDAREFVAVVLNDTEQVWGELFRGELGRAYPPPRLVLFTGEVRSACGVQSAAVGPFYCPADQRVYIDPAFWNELATRHRAPGDFAQAYVIAHEVAHHVQRLLGYGEEVDRIRREGDERASNRASVRLELQADYLAGVWAHHADKRYRILEAGDVEEAIRAANRIGDDTLVREAGGRVIPERFTHGTSKQRAHWFREGLRTGSVAGAGQLFELDYSRL